MKEIAFLPHEIRFRRKCPCFAFCMWRKRFQNLRGCLESSLPKNRRSCSVSRDTSLEDGCSLEHCCCDCTENARDKDMTKCFLVAEWNEEWQSKWWSKNGRHWCLSLFFELQNSGRRSVVCQKRTKREETGRIKGIPRTNLMFDHESLNSFLKQWSKCQQQIIWDLLGTANKTYRLNVKPNVFLEARTNVKSIGFHRRGEDLVAGTDGVVLDEGRRTRRWQNKGDNFSNTSEQKYIPQCSTPWWNKIINWRYSRVQALPSGASL